VRADLPGGQALGIQGQDDFVDAVQAPLPLPDDLRLEGPVPVAGHVDADLAGALGQYLLGPGAVADVAGLVACGGVLLMSQVLGQLLVQGGLDDYFGQLLQQPASPERRKGRQARGCGRPNR
jgi:hypothetical protein